MSLLGLGAAALNLFSKKKERKQSQAAAAQADPFASHRGQFGDLLANLYGFKSPAQQEATRKREDLLSQIESLKAGGAPAAPAPPGGLLKDLVARANTGRNRSNYGPTGQPNQLATLEKQLADLGPEQAQQNPMDFLKNLPGFQFALQSGTEAATRRAAAGGKRFSGNLLAELQQYGTNLASQRYGEEINRIAGFAGANAVPGAGAQYTADAPTPFAGAGSFLGELANMRKPQNALMATSSILPGL